MDAVSLLSRGTKVHRPAATLTEPQSVAKTPNTQLSSYSEGSDSLRQDGENGKSRKRKRAQGDTEALNQSGPAHARRTSSVASNLLRENGEEDDEDKQEGRFGREACKNLLRKHKLKVVELWSASAEAEHNGLGGTKKSGRRAKIKTNNENQKKHKRPEVVPQPLISFGELRKRYKLPRELCDNLDAQGYATPTEVQLGSLPLLLDKPPNKEITKLGDNESVAESCSMARSNNLLTVAPTGSGKTLAFLIPLIDSISRWRRLTKGRRGAHQNQAIILAPTKELARQTVNEARKLALNTEVSVTLMQKGMSVYPQSEKSNIELRSPSNQNQISRSQPNQITKADILVSTPLALLHSIRTEDQGAPTLSSVRDLVLDEADVLLDPFFRDQTMEVWSACTTPDLRVTLWSATMGSNIEELAISKIQQQWLSVLESERRFLPRPRLLRLVVGLKDSSIPSIEHKLIYAANERGKLMGLRQLLHSTPSSTDTNITIRPPILVFTQTIPRAIALHSELLYDVPGEAGGSSRIAALHSDLSDAKRDSIMTRFRKAEIWVLITTDLLARGVDFRGVNGVVNYDLPNSSAAYVHRAGRTGRAGREGGIAVTLYAKEDLPYVKNVANVIAASERQKSGGAESEASQRWLHDLLPKVGKKDKQQLKRRGVETRRTQNLQNEKGERVNTKNRISTKSAYDRRVENKKKGAIEANRGRQTEPERDSKGSDDDGFTSFED